MGLCRTCIEIELVVRYLTLKDTDKRCMRFLNYYSKDKTEWFRLNNKYFPESPLKQRADMKELLELASAYPSAHKWSDVPEGLKGMAAEPDPTMKAEDGTPATALFSYEVTYKMASQYVHGTVGSLDPAHATSAGDYYRVHPRKGRSTMGDTALSSAYSSVTLNLNRIFGYMNTDVPPQLQERYEKLGAGYAYRGVSVD